VALCGVLEVVVGGDDAGRRGIFDELALEAGRRVLVLCGGGDFVVNVLGGCGMRQSGSFENTW
jgi:hypothetical protein